jgi:hypothetical protein
MRHAHASVGVPEVMLKWQPTGAGRAAEESYHV